MANKSKRVTEACKRDEVVICDSCHYSTDIYNRAGICDRCLRAKTYWGRVARFSDKCSRCSNRRSPGSVSCRACYRKGMKGGTLTRNGRMTSSAIK